MWDFERTTRVTGSPSMEEIYGNLFVTIFDKNSFPRTILLDGAGKNILTFGRSERNDIILSSPYVSREHGRFRFKSGKWYIEDSESFGDKPSTNGLVYNNTYILSKALCEGDLIRIDDPKESIAEGVLFIFASQESENKWNYLPLEGVKDVCIGREDSCDIVLPHISVSKLHARIIKRQGRFYISDNGSTNGVVLNDTSLSGEKLLHEKDVITITTSKLIFTSSGIAYCCFQRGISVDAENIRILRGKGKKARVTGNDVSINIRPGELVAIIGGSGAGKSTILNCMCGYLPPSSGEIYINGIDLYRNFNALKKMIGYVPQSDIVYDNLTLYDMLSYTSKMRLPKDASNKEREAAIERAIRLVQLEDERNSYIRRLSGGQKKRASIAVELLSDPNLLFLDEPASGLDPGTERSLMQSLRVMADAGKTVILVTHSTLQLKLCDKIVFMGKGGKLCYFGPLEDALKFFGISDIVDVYNMITDHAGEWRKKYDNTKELSERKRPVSAKVSTGKERGRLQLPVLCSRYMKLVINDRQRLLLLLLQAPALALLISLVADGKQFDQYEITKSLLFALSCSAFWVGMLNAIQEICKERSILKREYMTGLSLNEYLLSKIFVLGGLSLIQSAMIIGVFSISVGLPKEGILIHPIAEFLITTFLTAAASTSMGLFVSSLFTNADRAMTVAPILLMPQILFSGLIFKLEGATELISWLAVCRWSMEGYGTTANLNNLDLKLQQEGVMIPHEVEDFFEFTVSHLERAWIVLLVFVIFFLVLARVVLARAGKEK